MRLIGHTPEEYSAEMNGPCGEPDGRAVADKLQNL